MAKKGLKIIDKRAGVGSRFKDASGNTFTKTDFVNSAALRNTYGVNVSTTKEGKKFIRSNPDNKKRNNLE